MKTKFTNLQFWLIGIVTFAILAIFGAFMHNWQFPYDHMEGAELKFGSVHTIVATLFWIVWLVGVIVFIANMVDTDFELFDNFLIDRSGSSVTTTDAEEHAITKKSFKTLIGWVLGISIILMSFSFVKKHGTAMVNLYNTSVAYHTTYDQKVQEKEGFADKMWSTYLQKEKITNINKDVFLAVTKVIMENRKDGANVAWKWLQENQQIPYEEFTKFYSDLSSFIATQREGYFGIEKQCQEISQANNAMLETFPNNLYNKILKIKRIEFKYGFLSEKTVATFKTGIEKVE